MSKRKLLFMELFVHGKINYQTYNRVLGYLTLIEEE